MSALDQLKKYSTVVADTGDINSISKYRPQDATTNPTLLLKACQTDSYRNLIEDSVQYGKERGKTIEQKATLAINKLYVNFGAEILKIIPGRVSTELDAKLSFDTKASIEKARDIIKLYEEVGVDRNRVLIKIASTWEGIEAAKQLEKEGIHCNMTLIFCLPQAAAAADADATLVSPFVGRITDYYKTKEKRENFPPKEDPGCLSVKRIFNYFKYHHCKTLIMGASFRNIQQIEELAGCDLLTISPSLLEELAQSKDEIKKNLDVDNLVPIEKYLLDEKIFKHLLSDDEMATTKLIEGIENFSRDGDKLYDEIVSKIRERK